MSRALLFDKHTTAKKLGVSVRTVERMIRDGELLAVRVRGSVRISAHTIQELVLRSARNAGTVKDAGGIDRIVSKLEQINSELRSTGAQAGESASRRVKAPDCGVSDAEGGVIEFSCYGEPIPQGSAKSITLPGRSYSTIVTDNPRLKKWREKVGIIAREKMRSTGAAIIPQSVPLRVDLQFVFKRPKSVKREHVTVKPDSDKLCRAIFDALTGIVYTDDAQIVAGEFTKSYGEWECVKVKVTEAKSL